MDRRPRHRIGGVLIDSGTFDWTLGRFPEFVDPEPAYHGLSYARRSGSWRTSAPRVLRLRDVGARSPFNSFLLLQGLETLRLRIERHSENALAVAPCLEDHPAVTWVNYPGLEPHPGYAIGRRYLHGGTAASYLRRPRRRRRGGDFIDNLTLFSPPRQCRRREEPDHPPGQHHPRAAHHEERLAAGVTDDLVRLSVGIEDVEDLIADLDAALRAATDPSAPRELVTA